MSTYQTISSQNINPPIDQNVYKELTYLCMYEVYSQHYTMCDVVKCYLKLICSCLKIPNAKHVMSANLHMQIYLRLFHNLLNTVVLFLHIHIKNVPF